MNNNTHTNNNFVSVHSSVELSNKLQCSDVN